MTPVEKVSARISRPAGVQRLGQALWMMVDETLASSKDLLWSTALLGPDGDRLLWEALEETGCLSLDNRLLARPLASMLCLLWEGRAEEEPTLVWTLPQGLVVPGVDENGYAKSVRNLIREAREKLVLVAPYLEETGIGFLQEELLIALARNVSATVITQDANAPHSWASAALEHLRREARGLSGVIQAYTALPTAPVLLHSKLVVSDTKRAIVGSANLTGKALLRNLETGVLSGARQAAEIERVVEAAIRQGHVQRVFGSNES